MVVDGVYKTSVHSMMFSLELPLDELLRLILKLVKPRALWDGK